uniref:Uncharacterized protein n=1 Tax=Octopus bimaculoides TaxID=37653 RepID=A0A0L8FI01_OCTBM
MVDGEKKIHLYREGRNAVYSKCQWSSVHQVQKCCEMCTMLYDDWQMIPTGGDKEQQSAPSLKHIRIIFLNQLHTDYKFQQP